MPSSLHSVPIRACHLLRLLCAPSPAPEAASASPRASPKPWSEQRPVWHSLQSLPAARSHSTPPRDRNGPKSSHPICSSKAHIRHDPAVETTCCCAQVGAVKSASSPKLCHGLAGRTWARNGSCRNTCFALLFYQNGANLSGWPRVLQRSTWELWLGQSGVLSISSRTLSRGRRGPCPPPGEGRTRGSTDCSPGPCTTFTLGLLILNYFEMIIYLKHINPETVATPTPRGDPHSAQPPLDALPGGCVQGQHPFGRQKLAGSPSSCRSCSPAHGPGPASDPMVWPVLLRPPPPPPGGSASLS